MNRHKVLVLATTLLLAGCVNGVGPDYKRPPLPSVAKFAVGQHPLMDAPPPSEWWRLLNDPILDDLVARTFAANKTIAEVKARLRLARAAYKEQRSDFLPHISATGAYARERQSASLLRLQQPLPDADLYEGAFDATWEIDIFGRVRREVEAARAQVQAAKAQLDDARVSLAAETARTYIAFRGAQQRLKVAHENAENQQRIYELTDRLSDGGRGTQVDVDRALGQLESTRASIPTLQADEAAARFELAVLTGQTPEATDDLLIAEGPIPSLPESIAIGDPAAMLRRRPDVRQAERELEAATAGIGVATADLFPRVTLTGTVGVAALGFSNLSNKTAFQYSAGPSITWNFLDAARVLARIEQTRAQAAGQLARYENSVLGALQDAETALTRFGAERERLGHLESAAQVAAEAASLTEERYSVGVDTFLNVLDAQRTLLADQDAVVQSKVQLAAQFIAIYKALGTGWESSEAQIAADKH